MICKWRASDALNSLALVYVIPHQTSRIPGAVMIWCSKLFINGSAPDRWVQGLLVMLTNVAGVAVITKLRAILLMEESFN